MCTTKVTKVFLKTNVNYLVIQCLRKQKLLFVSGEGCKNLHNTLSENI